jgi:6,7-dimethyl-8-ribityllumazine synthase
MPKVLLISSKTHSYIAERQLQIAQPLLQKKQVKYDLLRVNQVVDLLPALTMVLESDDYEGIIVCGVIISNNIGAHIVYQECLRYIYSTAGDFGLPMGSAIIYAESEASVDEAIEQDTVNAVLSCLSLIELKADLEGNGDKGSRYQN